MDIQTTPTAEWKLKPASTLEEIKQNLNFLVNTTLLSVPLYREFGLEGTFIDAPQPIARQRLIAELYEAIEKWEPRVKLKDISFTGTKDGQLYPVLHVEVVENE